MSNIESLIQKAQATNDKELYVQIGNAYMVGKNTTKDMSKAFTYYKKAADLGSADGKTQLGILYYRGYGVTRDCSMAKKYFQAASSEGSVAALFQLGMMCYNGDYGFFAGKGKAFEFWLKAAKKGYVEAQYNIATSYLDDTWGEEKSDRKAAFWYMCAYQNRKASKKTIEDAKAQLVRLSNRVDLNSIKDEIVRKYPQYLNL